MQFSECFLYKISSKKKIIKLLLNRDDKNLLKILNNETKLLSFIKKNSNTFLINKKTKEKVNDIKYDKKIHRNITFIKKNNEYKIMIKKLNKVLSNYIRNQNLEFLYSAIKNVDYVKNAAFHKENNYFFKLDFENYFNNISSSKIYNFFKYKLEMSIDISKILTLLCTAADKPDNSFLKQGLETSPIISFLVNIDVFEKIFNYCKEHNLKMSLYIDDLVISSKDEIKHEYIQKIINILVANKIKLNKQKIKYYDLSNKNVIITGIKITKNHMLQPQNKINAKLRIEKKLNNNQNKIGGLISNINYIKEINSK